MKIKKNLNKWRDILCSWKTQYTVDFNFPQIETARGTFKTHTQIPPQAYKFVILGVKPRHALFRGKKNYPHLGHFDL